MTLAQAVHNLGATFGNLRSTSLRDRAKAHANGQKCLTDFVVQVFDLEHLSQQKMAPTERIVPADLQTL